MSSTNKTTYYELPQFVDNDIFNPLVDDNDAYNKIDTALHNIADAEADDASEIVNIKSRLNSAEGDINALKAQNGNSVLTTTAQTLSGAVNELDADTSALDGRLDIVEDDINNVSTGLKSKVTALETQNGNDQLTTTAQTLSGAVNELNSDISIINANKNTILLFGDSWACNSPTQIPTYVANHYNATVKNYAVAGSGFNVTGGYKDQLNVMSADPTVDLDDVKFAIIVCGLNDHSRGATATEFAQMFNEWKAIYDTKFADHQIPEVYWFHNYSIENEITPSTLPNSNPTDYWNQYRYYREVRRTVKGIHCFNCFGFVPGNEAAWQVPNYRHPSQAGSIAYSENICFCIDGAEPCIYPYEEIGATFDTTVVTDVPTLTARFLIRNSELYCELNPAVKAISEVPSGGVNIIFDRFVPAYINTGIDLGCGVQISAFDYDNKQITLAPNCTNLRSYYADGNGRTVKEIGTGSLS